MADRLPLSVWPCAQQPARIQRRDRYVAESTAHPGKMLPELARRAIEAFSRPRDIVLDPMCGIGTSLVEAVHLDRDAIGVEYEPRWAALAEGNVALAEALGATGRGNVWLGDARHMHSLLPRTLHGRCALLLTSPPYGSSVHGQVRVDAGMLVKSDVSYSDDFGQPGACQECRADRRTPRDLRCVHHPAPPRRDRCRNYAAVAARRSADRLPGRCTRRGQGRRLRPAAAARRAAGRSQRRPAGPAGLVLSASAGTQGPGGWPSASGHRSRGRARPQEAMTPDACRSALAPNAGAGGAPAVPSPESGHLAEGAAPAPPRRPQRRGSLPCALGPRRPAGPGSTPRAGAASGVDLSTASRPPRPDEDREDATATSGNNALPPGAMRPLARALLAAAIDLHTDLRLLPDQRRDECHRRS